MIIYGYAKQTRYNNDGMYEVQVRIPQIHGPFLLSDAKGKTIHNYTRDEDLPYYPGLLTLDTTVGDGDVVMLESHGTGMGSNLSVVGLTGTSYYTGLIDYS